MRRSASPRDAPHRIRSFLPLRLGFSSTWPTATRGNAGFNLEHYHQLTYESILHRHDRLSKRSQATLKPTKRGAASISPASGKRGWMASFNCGEGEDRRFNLAHHHQLTYEPILHHHDRLTNRFQVIKGHFSGELRRCYRAPVGFVFLWPFTALAGQWRRQTDSPAQCAPPRGTVRSYVRIVDAITTTKLRVLTDILDVDKCLAWSDEEVEQATVRLDIHNDGQRIRRLLWIPPAGGHTAGKSSKATVKCTEFVSQKRRSLVLQQLTQQPENST